jgi:GTP-binding protein EngB required for normal cell division
MGKGPGLGYKFLDESVEHPFPFDRGAKQVRMIDVANDITELPDYGAAPEVALIGRSNVGKSTLLNAVMGFKSHQIEAKVSDKPGETKSLHFYAMGKPRHRGPPALVVVDMPGYGFAFMDEETQKKIFDLVRFAISVHAFLNNIPYAHTLYLLVQSATYLLTRGPALKRVLLVVDARHGIKIADTNFFASLTELVQGGSRPDWRLQIVLTKCDMVSRDELARRANEIQDSLRDRLASIALSNLPIVMVSGLERKGIIDLHRELASLVPRKEKTEKAAAIDTDTVAPSDDQIRGIDVKARNHKESANAGSNVKKRTENVATATRGAVIEKTVGKDKEVQCERNEGKAENPNSESKNNEKRNEMKKTKRVVESTTRRDASPSQLRTSICASSPEPDRDPARISTGSERPKTAEAMEPSETAPAETEAPRRTGGRKKKAVLRRMRELSDEEEEYDDDEDFAFEDFEDMPDEDPKTRARAVKDRAPNTKAEDKKLSETLKPNPMAKRAGSHVTVNKKSKVAIKSPIEDVGAPIESGDVATLDIGSRLSAILEHYEKIAAKQEVSSKPVASAAREASSVVGKGKQQRFSGRDKSEEEVARKMQRKEMYMKKFAKKNKE